MKHKRRHGAAVASVLIGGRKIGEVRLFRRGDRWLYQQWAYRRKTDPRAPVCAPVTIAGYELCVGGVQSDIAAAVDGVRRMHRYTRDFAFTAAAWRLQDDIDAGRLPQSRQAEIERECAAPLT